jgi:hypothetical protein
LLEKETMGADNHGATRLAFLDAALARGTENSLVEVRTTAVGRVMQNLVDHNASAKHCNFILAIDNDLKNSL